MENETKISPKYLALVLNVPGYLFSDLSYIQGVRDGNDVVEVNDPTTPSINGIKLAGEHPDHGAPSCLFIPRSIVKPRFDRAPC